MKHAWISGAAIFAMALGMVAPANAQTSPENMTRIVRELTTDAHRGRAPGGPAEMVTINYLVEEYQKLGLEPAGDNGSFVQEVPIVGTQLLDGYVNVNGKKIKRSLDYHLTTYRQATKAKLQSAPMVFVGYGVSAPEAGWDDFKDVDVRGKIVVMLINDPDFRAAEGEDAFGRFGGNRMTYYGRWTYKYEEAVRQGAAGALIIHDTAGAAYGWPTVIAGGGKNYDMATTPQDQRLVMQGWISDSYARSLFQKAGLDFEAEMKAARSKDFKPKDLKVKMTASFDVSVEKMISRNVVGKITGTKYPEESIMFGAHWDAYGEGEPDEKGRIFRPGANDDALGVAGVIDVAREFLKGPKPERTILFGQWTGEENGLLGSGYHAENPNLPLNKMVAYFGFDVLQTAGLSHDVQLVGYGQNNLDEDFKVAVAAQGRRVTPELYSERGLNYRADHFAFGRKGVPTLLLMEMSGPPDLVEGGVTAGEAWLDGYMKCYHQTCNEWTPDWDLRGAAQDIDAVVDVARKMANSRHWPSWNDSAEFKAAERKLRQ